MVIGMNYYEDDDDVVLREHCNMDGYQVLYPQEVVEEIGYLQAQMEMSLEFQDAKRHRRMMRYLEKLKRKTER
jgi:hypothetical protein